MSEGERVSALIKIEPDTVTRVGLNCLEEFSFVIIPNSKIFSKVKCYISLFLISF